MSDLEHCDVCRAQGMRRSNRWAPDGWLYGFSTDDTEGGATVVMVCSEKCRDSFFKPWDTSTILEGPHPDKLTVEHLRARLFALLGTFSIQRILTVLADCVKVKHKAGGNPCKPFRWTKPAVHVPIHPKS